MFRSSVVSLKYGTLSVAVSSSRKAEEIMANFALNHTLMLSLLLVLLVSLLVPLMITAPKSKPNSRESKDKSLKMAVTTTTTEIFGVKIEKNPPQSKISELGVTSWPKYGFSSLFLFALFLSLLFLLLPPFCGLLCCFNFMDLE